MNLVLKHSIQLNGKEDYARIGNSRIGGNPDLPIGMNYPVFENGFYEFILQLNLKDHPVKGLPNQGLFSIFYGSLDFNEAIAYYFDEEEILENKKVPVELEFAGVTDFYEHKSHKVEVIEEKLRARIEYPGHNNPEFNEEDNIMHWKMDFLNENSYLMDKGIQDKSHIYLESNGFKKLIYGYGIWIDELNKEIKYRGRDSNKVYSNINDLKNCEVTRSYFTKDIESYEMWIDQLEKFEAEKEYHLKRFCEYRCILSLSSSVETKMVWGDSHKLEFFGFETDLLESNIVKLNSTIP